MTDFYEFAEERGFSDRVYPYSVKGLHSMKVILKSLKWSAIFAVGKIIPYLLRVMTGLNKPDFNQVVLSDQPWFSLTKQEIYPDAIANDLQLQNVTFLLKNFSASLLSLIEKISLTVSLSLLTLAILVLPVWIYFAIRRMQNFEREILRNDFEAATMKMGMVRRLSLNDRIRGLNKRISKAEQSQSNAGQTRAMEIERMALTSIKNMRVFINTRQSLNGPEIERQYRIELTPEYEAAAQERMMSELKNLDKVAENEVKGKVSFGALTASTDRSLLTMKAVAVFKDRYDFSDWAEIADTDNIVYEGTFKLSHLTDNRTKVKEISHKAQIWAERSGAVLDMFFATSNAKVDRLSTFVSASNALFTYKISFRIDVQGFEKFQDGLDAAFRTTGTTVQIKDGDLLVALPLPKSLIVPIDVGTMYREVFGNDEIAVNAMKAENDIKKKGER